MKKLTDFFETQVSGKMLYTPEITFETDEPGVSGIYADMISFGGIRYCRTTLSIDMFSVTTEQLYRTGYDGSRGELYLDLSAVSLYRYELARRKSTGSITGMLRYISGTGRVLKNSSSASDGTVSSVYDIVLTGNDLTWTEDQALYHDQDDGDSYRPVAFRSENSLYFEDGKLCYSSRARCFDVDGLTLRRDGNGDAFPPVIAREL